MIRNYTKTILAIDKITIDPSLQGRIEINEGHIAYLLEKTKERQEEGTDRHIGKLDDIKVFIDKHDNWLVDGFHRLEAAKKAGCTHIRAMVAPGTLEDAQWTCLTLNDKNCLPLTEVDKRNIIRKALLHPKAKTMSDREIARHCHVSHETVRSFINKTQLIDPDRTRVDQNGREHEKKPQKEKKTLANLDSEQDIAVVSSDNERAIDNIPAPQPSANGRKQILVWEDECYHTPSCNCQTICDHLRACTCYSKPITVDPDDIFS